MNPGITDSQRRSEIAERTRLGLEDDLEDLQTELSVDLEWYEDRIHEVAQRAPNWTSVDPRRVVDLFKIDRDDLPEEGFLGPRMVAIAAEAADGFVAKWFPSDGEAEPPVEGALDEFERDLRELLVFLEGLEGATEKRASRAHRILEEWMETNLAHLDELRKNDLEALRDLVGEGALETGPDARAEKAQLWDEQRKRADELREIWDEFHALVDDGARYTYSGLGDVARLARRACEGLQGFSPSLRERELVDEYFADVDFEPDVDESGETDDAGDESARAEEDESRPESWLRRPSESGREPETEILDDGGSGNEGSDESNTEVDDAERREDAVSGDGSTVEPDQEASDESSGAEISETRPMLGRREGEDDRDHEMEPTRPASDVPVGPTADLESPPDEPEAGTEAEPTDAPEEEPDAPADRQTGEAELPSDGPETARGMQAPPNEGGEPSESEAAEARALEATCLRIRTEWQSVGVRALAAAFGPPTAFLAGMIAISIGSLLGVEAAFNPMARWSWSEPAVGVAIAWWFCTPLLMGWRPRWSGWQFQFVQEAELRDEATFAIEPDGFALGRISLEWSSLDTYRLRRWESPDDDLQGWLLIVEPKYYEAIQIIAPASSRSRWDASSRAVVEPPRDAWQVDAAALEQLRRRLGERGIESPHSDED